MSRAKGQLKEMNLTHVPSKENRKQKINYAWLVKNKYNKTKQGNHTCPRAWNKISVSLSVFFKEKTTNIRKINLKWKCNLMSQSSVFG